MKFWTAGLMALLVALTFSTTACAEKKTDGLYTTALTGEVVVGKEGNLELKIIPAKGYKWNKEYPAKIKLPESTLVKFKKQVLKKNDGDIVAKGTNGVAPVACTGTTAGTETLTAEASFSVCSAETCQVLRKRSIALKVVVK